MRPDASGFPERGPGSRTLGARRDIDVRVDPDGEVGPGTGGMSVSPGDAGRLPEHRRPPELGGTGKDPVWRIDEEALGPDLVYRPDPDDSDSHGFVEPAGRMPYDRYEQALELTSPAWRRVDG